MKLSTIRDGVYSLCQELQKYPDFTIARVNKMINRGYVDFARRTKCIGDQIDITTVANQFTYTATDQSKIANIFRIDEVRYIQPSVDEVGIRITPYPGGYGNLPRIKIYSSFPNHYWVRGMGTSADGTDNNSREIGLWPIVSDVSGTIRIKCSIFPYNELSGDTDEPLILDAWTEALVFYAAYRMFDNYSHEKKQYGAKAYALKNEYFDIVRDFLNTASEDTDDEFPIILDVFEGSTWNEI